MSNKLKQKQKEKEKQKRKKVEAWSLGRQFVGYLLDVMICNYMLLVIVLLPLYNEEGYSHIGTDKATCFRRISVYGGWFILPTVAIYLIFAGVEWVKTNNIKWQDIKSACQRNLSLTDKCALLYGVTLILSYLCSPYKESALWGADRWFMGLIPQLILLAIYFLISRFWMIKKWIFLLFLPVSAVVFLLGYLNRFGIFPFNMRATSVLFISTIGNINWYCGYFVSVFFGGYYLLWQSDRIDGKGIAVWKKMLLMVYVAVGFATLVTQGSMSGIFTLAVMLIVTFCLSAKDSKRMLLFWQETLLLSLMCLLTFVIRSVFHGEVTFTDAVVEILTNSIFPIIATVVSVVFVVGIWHCDKKNSYPVGVFQMLARVAAVGAIAAFALLVGMITLNTLRPGSLGSLSEYSVFTFSPEWGSNRGATWKAGIMCFAEQNVLHKLIGAGPDSMEAFIYQGGSSALKQLVTERFGTARLTNAHNEWITILVNTGILGFTGYVGMMVSGIVRFIKYGILSQKAFIGACGFCLLAYSVNNMFSFQQSMSAATIFVIFGIGEAYARSIRLNCF